MKENKKKYIQPELDLLVLPDWCQTYPINNSYRNGDEDDIFSRQKQPNKNSTWKNTERKGMWDNM